MQSSELMLLTFENNIGDQHLSISNEKLEELTKLADRSPPLTRSATADSFTSWIFQLEHPPYYGPRTRYPSPLSICRQIVSRATDRWDNDGNKEWDLLYCDDSTKDSKTYESSVIRLNGQPLRLKPDVVFKHRSSGFIIILEYKIPSPRVTVPRCGWPNLALQLWCYSWIDEWASNPNVALIGVPWIWDGALPQLPDLLPRTLKRDTLLQKNCRALFELWGGDIDSRSLPRKARLLLQ